MNNSIKKQQLHTLAEYKKKLCRAPKLKFLFLELTMRCNESCLHCGSRCGDVVSNELTKEQYFSFLDKVKRDFPKSPMLCITGGEPLLRKDFFDIIDYANRLGFAWGMTSNATLITQDIAKKLKQTGMRTISVSVDGTEKEHDSFRRTKGGYARTICGIKNLLYENFDSVQITTVVTRKNIDTLDEMFEMIKEIDVDSWRVINIEPIGRALTLNEYTLTPTDYKKMFDFIRQKRSEGYPVTYGCSHYLGLEYEREVRDWYFLCNAGIYTASIMANGDIGACLDIERRSETIQGNILNDDFTKVWHEKFEIFRTPLAEKNEKCRKCDSREFCGGGSYHSWDYDKQKQMMCFKDIFE